MTKLKQNFKWSVVGSVKPSVQKRDSRDSIGFITKKLVPIYFVFLSWIFSQDKITCSRLSEKILHLWTKNGSTFLVKYLKESYLLTQKYVSGYKVESTNDFPLDLTGGLPRIIPGPWRSEIRKGNPVVIRAVLTALAIFRIIKCPGTLKLGSIVDPFKGISTTLNDYEVSQALRLLFGPRKDLSDLKEIKWLFLMTAGPSHSVSWRGIWLDIKTWSESPLLPTLLNYIHLFGDKGSRFLESLLPELERVKSLHSVVENRFLGRLSEKEEAAGKIRVFAITDSITQAVLAPLHDFIFDLLKSLPMDGTFDQGAPLKRLFELKQQGKLESQLFYSYDLSAATDRLPIDLQAQVLKLLFGNLQIGNLWKTLLSDRDWYFKDNGLYTPLRYSVGQPMGALSSWAMLALTHHVIVQIAAYRVGLKNFTHYALLGDDIVIANNAVAQSYHHIMTEILGVEINLSKSLISATHFEYAKRLVSEECELTPIGPKNLLILLRSPTGLISVLRDAYNKGLVLNEQIVDEMMLHIPYYRDSTWKSFTWAIKGPFGLVPSEAGLSPKIRLNNSLTSVAVDLLISAIDEEIHNSNYESWSKDISSFNKMMSIFEVRGFHTFLAESMNYSCDLIRNYDSEKSESMNDLYDCSESKLFFVLREDLLSKIQSQEEDRPVRRLIFNGPLIHFGFYNQGWIETVMSYITHKIHSGETIVPTIDPFKDLSLSKPERYISRGDKFFKKVYINWVDRCKVPRTYF